MFYGWVIVAAAFAMLLITVGVPFYGMPFFYDHFVSEFGWNRAQTTSGIAVSTILVQPIAGMLVHRLRTRSAILLGSGFLAASFALFGLGNGSLLLYYAAWCTFMIGNLFAGVLPHQILLSQWFLRRRGLAIGVSYLGLGLGGAISQKYVFLPLIQNYGWRTALFAVGAGIAILMPLILLIVRNRPADMGQATDGDAESPAEMMVPALPLRDILTHRAFWLLALGSCASVAAIGSVNQHMKLLFRDAGLSQDQVANTTFLILMSSLTGRVVMGWLADRFSKKAVMVSAFLMVACPIPLLLFVSVPGVAELFAVAFGFGLGADYMLIPLMAAEAFGSNSLGRVMGIVQPADSIGQTCFPFLLGAMYDRLGNYDLGLGLLVVIALLGAVAIAAIPPRRRAGEEAELATVALSEGTR